MFKMKESLADLQVTKLEERFGLIHVIFQQYFQDIPVEGGIYGVHMTKDKKVYFAAGEYYDNVGLSTVTPAISLAQAIMVRTFP
jgi:Zn-dependent metalloprotease